ncbi:MAG: metallophosphoesterase family protein [Cyanobacteria bacterium]|nr:metallophosphoesterase family protein [Cyanobacteria bacterium CG_2015-16_32_12]NCO77205.1 metallophosphoesterase family protein [Cyanobacteria bacterium CG_2015-22_32_23]NCQ05373.1 metallophosphoesterase family protein [Cyanobacteria bacterium CG_2015-09_32_10]NCQ43077.1 metallophosphoesterase family protein [Cyanobacteria bacterium CG_2015-04_32_10]NCS86050.1 metallophosphoesterase family protein [Cyanobacteria bacterium CG_2015-02_32_10]
MKIAVMSCIHANLPAFEAVLKDIDENQCDSIYSLGDLVGYGPHPNEIVNKIRELQIPSVQGCWDEDIVEGLNSCECSYPSLLAEKRGIIAHEWTNQQITAENRQFLAKLPHTIKLENLCFAHSSPNSNHEYILPEMDAFTALERVLSADADVLFCGHTHIPYDRTLNAGMLQIRVNQSNIESESERQFQTPIKRIINVGSVGEPRHGRPNATYVIYNTETEEIILREVGYDYQSTCRDIIEKGLPPIFAWRLAKGLEFAEKAEDATHVCQR